MRKRLLITAVIALAGLLGSTVARGELAQNGNLRINFDGSFNPQALPRDRPVPVTVDIQGAISTTDGSRPPVLQRLEIDLNRNGKLSSEGLPTCTSSQLQSSTTEQALERCRPALVGHGSFGARIDFTSLAPIPAHGKMLAFNGLHHGKPALLLQLYAGSPVRIAFVLPLTIQRQTQGRFGTVLAAQLPTLAGGSATVTEIKLKLGRTYSHQGRRRGFISASCAAPAGFSGAIFAFARGSFHFADGTTISTALTRDCRVR